MANGTGSIGAHEHVATAEAQQGDPSYCAHLATDIRAELHSILSAGAHSFSERSRRLLQYIVDQALAGRGHRLKAYTLAVEVLGRPDNFDPQRDPIVRIEVARLRRELEHYYLTDGREDRLIIDIPKGGYAPVFALREHTADPQANSGRLNRMPSFVRGRNKLLLALAVSVAATTIALASWHRYQIPSQSDSRPTLAIRTIQSDGTAPAAASVASVLTNELIQHLSDYGDLLSVEVGDGLDSRYELTVIVGPDDSSGQPIQIRAINRIDGTIIWADTLALAKEGDASSAHLFASEIATKLGAPYGMLFQIERQRISKSGAAPSDYTCAIKFYSYRAELSASAHAEASLCIDKLLEVNSKNATVLALASLLAIDEKRYGFPSLRDSAEPPLARALELARAALRLDPTNVRAAEAMMFSLTFAGETQAALDVGKRAMDLHPVDRQLQGEYGHRLALTGQWVQGCGLVREAQQAANFPPTYFQAILSLCSYFAGKPEEAEVLIQQATGTRNPYHHVIAAAVLAESGDLRRAREEVDWLQRNAADLLPSLRSELTFKIQRPEDSQRLIRSLEKAGLTLN